MGFFHFVKQQDGVGTTSDSISQLTALIVAYVARWGTQEAAHLFEVNQVKYCEKHLRNRGLLTF